MTIRLTPHTHNPGVVAPNARLKRGWAVTSDSGTPLATCDTEAEAETARRAFENVLAPRFTRDEAIAIVSARVSQPVATIDGDAFVSGVRQTLEALAAAGVFSDGRNMADKLDAAGIR